MREIALLVCARGGIAEVVESGADRSLVVERRAPRTRSRDSPQRMIRKRARPAQKT